jgi:hypothetical protein
MGVSLKSSILYLFLEVMVRNQLCHTQLDQLVLLDLQQFNESLSERLLLRCPLL